MHLIISNEDAYCQVRAYYVKVRGSSAICYGMLLQYFFYRRVNIENYQPAPRHWEIEAIKVISTTPPQ